MPDSESKIANCLVVDDEPMARDVLRRYIERVPTLRLAGECSNAIDALVFLQNKNIDLIFLDIRMPELLGTDFVKALHNPPKIIFTTAFKEYALDGYELDVIDYLLKPVRFERFLKAVSKAFPKRDEVVQNNGVGNERKTGTDFIYLRVDRKLVKIILSDILYIESARDYVKVFTTDKCFITRQTISSVEAMLSGNEFVRIHRSYIVAVSKVKSLTNELVEIGAMELPIGKLYKNNFLKLQGG
ncbi:MAG TPA: LytTR family DNA-binding domain-containing protein [Chitinophagaceae bacterium]|nr:LytTR family DNA-binding domain-containing protein [Chitinophagaceae bacterium]